MTYSLGKMSEPVMSWDNIKKLDLQILTKSLLRAPSVQRLYMEQRNDPTHQPRLLTMLRNGLCRHNGIWLRENDYPYQTPPDVEHHVLWFSDTETISSLQTAQSWVIDYLGLDETQIVVCCNDIQLKTVPEINHYHVFIRHS